MVIGFHLIWTAYGWWLPNDPRGSMSRDVVCETIAGLGPHHYGRKSRQPKSNEIREFYERAETVLQHELLKCDDADVQIIGESFAQTITRRRYTCYACAIMPDHVHLLIRKHRDHAEEMIDYLQGDSQVTMIDAKRRPFDHPVWGGPGWKVFLRRIADIERTIKYILDNPRKIGRPVQDWGFVKPYDAWLPGGHPERSAKR